MLSTATSQSSPSQVQKDFVFRSFTEGVRPDNVAPPAARLDDTCWAQKKLSSGKKKEKFLKFYPARIPRFLPVSQHYEKLQIKYTKKIEPRRVKPCQKKQWIQLRSTLKIFVQQKFCDLFVLPVLHSQWSWFTLESGAHVDPNSGSHSAERFWSDFSFASSSPYVNFQAVFVCHSFTQRCLVSLRVTYCLLFRTLTLGRRSKSFHSVNSVHANTD